MLIDEFGLEDVHHAPAFFDVQKLRHLNGEYIRELPVASFIAPPRPGSPRSTGVRGRPTDRPPWPPERFDPGRLQPMAPLVQERVATLAEVPGMVDFIFLADPVIDEASWEKAMANDDAAAEILDGAIDAYATCAWDAAALGGRHRELAERWAASWARPRPPSGWR